MYLSEKQMKDIDAMIAQGQDIKRIVDKIFEDTPRSIEGIWERIEDIFLSELSTGYGCSEHNNGTGVRINMNFYEANKFNASALWSADNSTPLDDIQKVFDKALDDQNIITDVWMDDTALTLLYKNSQVRGQYAFNQGIAPNTVALVPVLDFTKLADIFKTRWDVTLHRVARKIKTELNGKKQNHTPWQKGMVSFTCDEVLGSLVWTTTAEATRPVEGVVYQSVDEYILVSKFSKTDPLQEFTTSQAMVLPILDNVDRIYTLDSQTVQE